MRDEFLDKALSEIGKDDTKHVTVIYKKRELFLVDMLGAKWGKCRSEVLRKALSELLEKEGLVDEQIRP